MLNLLLGLKDEWQCALDASVDATKADVTNGSLELFSFCLDFLPFPDAKVLKFSDEGWVSEVSSSLVIFCEDLPSSSFLKEEDSVTRRCFDFRLEIFDSRLDEEDKKFSVMLKEVVMLMLFSEIKSLMLRSPRLNWPCHFKSILQMINSTLRKRSIDECLVWSS